MRKPLGPSIGLMVVMVLVLAIACAPVATPTPTATPTPSPTPSPASTFTPTPTATPWAVPPGLPTPTPRDSSAAQPPPGAQVVKVGEQIEHDGITVGLKEVWLTDRETVLRFWHDCAPFRNLETMGTADLRVDGVNLHGSGGGGPGCDASYLREFRFPALPRGAREIAFRYGPFLGPDTRDLTLELPIGLYLSRLDPKFGGEVEMDLVAESEGLVYRFTKVSAGAANFSLRYEPANDPARWQPFSGPPGVEVTLEDDRGNRFTISGGSSGWDGRNDFALKDGTLNFRGHVDVAGTLWKLTASKLGKVYTGPWEFRVDVSAFTGGLPLATPTQTPGFTVGPRPTPTPITLVKPFHWPSRLKEALSWVPQEFADKPLKFADWYGARKAVGMEEVRGEDLIDNIMRLFPPAGGSYAALPSHELFSTYTSMLNQAIGLNLFGFDLGIWLDYTPEGYNSPTFTALEGPVDWQTMSGKLKAIEYKEAAYRDTTYYWLNEEPRADLRRPLRQLGAYLNRMAFVDGTLLIGPSTAVIQSLIDVRRGKGPSLAESKPHAAIAEAIGDGLLGAAVFPPEWIVESWSRQGNTGRTGPVARLDRYLEGGPSPWGKLSSYSLALIGYRYAGEADEVVVALYYPDPAGAERDAKELERRWNTFHYDPIGSHEAEIPVTNSCAPFTTKVVAQGDGSVLIGSCKAAVGQHTGGGGKGAGLWNWLFMTGELQFLAPDIAELKRVAEQK